VTGPSVEDVIARAIHAGVREGWVYDSPVERSLAMWDPRPTAAAVVAAIRAMTVAQQAELLGGRVSSRQPCCRCNLPDAPDGEHGVIVAARALGPWRAEP
jgi:hypothetical protein